MPKAPKKEKEEGEITTVTLNPRELRAIRKWLEKYPTWWSRPSDFVHEAVRDFLRYLEAGGPQATFAVRHRSRSSEEDQEPHS